MADLWSAFEHDPRSAAYAPMRAGDRVALVRTLGKLPAVVADLVPTTTLVPEASAGSTSAPHPGRSG